MLVARSRDFLLLPRHFYSPVPVVEELPAEVFRRRRPMHDIAFDLGAQIAWAEGELAPFFREFDPPLAQTEQPERFNLHNDAYEEGDADVGWAMIRWLKPRRVVELGSGNSTLLLAEALEANRREGVEAHFVAYDPHPSPRIRAALDRGVPGLDEYRPQPAQEIPLERVSRLGADDVLFVDTSHTLKIGGEVDFVFSEVLPLLAPGVYVHFHDIWLPWEYDREFIMGRGYFWNEQYVLEAFLSGNRGWRVVFATRALSLDHPDRMAKLMPRFDPRKFATSFWIARGG